MPSLGALLAGCVVPLPYPEESGDAGQGGYPPVIRAGTPPLGEPTSLFYSAPNTDYTLDVEDRDLDDTIYLRIFRDYDPQAPMPPIVDRLYPPGGEALRTLGVEVGVVAWCPELPEPRQYIFEVVVADRPFDPNPTPPVYRSVTLGGDFTVRPWVITCEP